MADIHLFVPLYRFSIVQRFVTYHVQLRGLELVSNMYPDLMLSIHLEVKRLAYKAGRVYII